MFAGGEAVAGGGVGEGGGVPLLEGGFGELELVAVEEEVGGCVVAAGAVRGRGGCHGAGGMRVVRCR